MSSNSVDRALLQAKACNIVALAASTQVAFASMILVSAFLGAVLVEVPAGQSSNLLMIVCYYFCGLYSFVGHQDLRSRYLGVSLILVASSFARKPIILLLDSTPTLPTALQHILDLPIDALLPFYAWMFFGNFPRTYSYRLDYWAGIGVWCSLLFSLILVLSNVIDIQFLSEWLDRTDERGFYWVVCYLPVMVGCAFSFFKRTIAAELDRERIAWMILAIVLSIAPALCVIILGALFSNFAEYATGGSALVIETVRIFLLLLPLGVTYAISATWVFPIRRNAKQLRFYGVVSSALAILVALAVSLFVSFGDQYDSIFDFLFIGPALQVVLIFSVVLGLFSYVNFRQNTVVPEKLFNTLQDIGSANSKSLSSSEVRVSLEKIVARQLGANFCEIILFEEERQASHSEGGIPPTIETILNESTPALSLDKGGLLWQSIPGSARGWIETNAIAMIARLHRADMGLLGYVLVGPSEDRLPYEHLDLQILGAAAATITSTVGEGRGVVVRDSYAPLVLCLECKKVMISSYSDRCSCGGEVTWAQLRQHPTDKYRVIRWLGQGGMGAVYLAEETALQRLVALKICAGYEASTQDGVDLVREAQTMARVEHENIARLFTLESWAGQYVMVSEYMEQGTLADILEEGPLPLPQVLQLGLALSAALVELHSLHFIHQDIKPSNIGIRNDVFKLLDFGLASSHSIERHGQRGAAGTLTYASPEHLCGGEPRVGDDLWSLGVVLHEAVVGHKTSNLEELDHNALWLQMIDNAPESYESRFQKLWGIICSMLERDPLLRPSSAEILLRSLKSV